MIRTVLFGLQVLLSEMTKIQKECFISVFLVYVLLHPHCGFQHLQRLFSESELQTSMRPGCLCLYPDGQRDKNTFLCASSDNREVIAKWKAQNIDSDIAIFGGYQHEKLGCIHIFCSKNYDHLLRMR